MSGFTIHVEGLEEVKAHVNPARWQKFITDILKAVEPIMLERSRANSPIGLTGETKSTINARRTKRTVKVGPGTYYARYVEFGTRRGIRPQRFMRTSLQEARGGIERAADSGVRDFAQGKGL